MSDMNQTPGLDLKVTDVKEGEINGLTGEIVGEGTEEATLDGVEVSVDTASVLDEITITEEKGEAADGDDVEESEIFHQYTNKRDIGLNIFKELHKRFDVKRGGFAMDDISKDIGILSQCQALQSWVSLALDFGLDFDEKKKYAVKQKGSIREIMDVVIANLIPQIMRKKDGGETEFVFDASPYARYEDGYFSEKYSNIDAITWVIPTFLTVLKYHADKDEICQWEDELIEIIKHGLKYIVNAFIEGKMSAERSYSGISRGNNKDCLRMGWNFTNNCEEPSLYYTFTVGECYLDLYKTFGDVLGYAFAKKNFDDFKLVIPENAQEEHEKLFKDGNDRYIANGHLARLYRRICDIPEDGELVVQGTDFGILGDLLKRVGLAVWDFVGDKLADSFFYNDLGATLSENEIMMSTTSDALFNTVYIVNIMLAGGVDEYFLLQRKAIFQKGALKPSDKKKAEEYQRDYDNLLESCLLAVQKAFRTYDKLKDYSKEYIVDQFLIGFNERFDEHRPLVSELRKLRMKTFSLLPMLIHTNNVISEYLIKYPQYNMRKYLEYILENRYWSIKDGKAHWIWEKDGYFSGSNCYFIVALDEFYAYYEKYEKRYLTLGAENDKFEKEVIEEFRRKQNLPGGEIATLNAKLKKKEKASASALAEKNAKIKELEERLANIERPVEDAVKLIIEQELRGNIVDLLVGVFSGATKALTANAIDPTEDKDGKYLKLYESMFEMVLAKFLNEHYSAGGRSLEPNKPEDREKYAEHKKKASYYLTGLLSTAVTDSKSKVDADDVE